MDKKYEWIEVDKETFNKFLDSYPRKLVANFFMDRYSFYDFTFNEEPCPASDVAYDDTYSGCRTRQAVINKEGHDV